MAALAPLALLLGLVAPAAEPLRFTLADGSRWEVNPYYVAGRYAASPINRDVPIFSAYLYALRSRPTLEFWAYNNVPWSEIEPHARRVAGPPRLPPGTGWGAPEHRRPRRPPKE